jgi:hypothetical protein
MGIQLLKEENEILTIFRLLGYLTSEARCPFIGSNSILFADHSARIRNEAFWGKRRTD